MNSNEEIIPSYVLDWINKKLDEFDKRLDKYDEFLSSYTTPAISYHEQPSWPVATVVGQPRPPPDPPNGQPELYHHQFNPYTAPQPSYTYTDSYAMLRSPYAEPLHPPPPYVPPRQAYSYHEQPCWPVAAAVPQEPYTYTDSYAPLQNSYAGHHPWQHEYQPMQLPSQPPLPRPDCPLQPPQPQQPSCSHRRSATAPPPLVETFPGASSSTQAPDPQQISEVTEQIQDISIQQEVTPGRDMQAASSKSLRFPLRPGKGNYGTRCVVKANHFFAALPDKDLHHKKTFIQPPTVIFYGNNEGRCSTSQCVFDPGGDISPKRLFSTFFIVSWFPP